MKFRAVWGNEEAANGGIVMFVNDVRIEPFSSMSSGKVDIVPDVGDGGNAEMFVGAWRRGDTAVGNAVFDELRMWDGPAEP